MRRPLKEQKTILDAKETKLKLIKEAKMITSKERRRKTYLSNNNNKSYRKGREKAVMIKMKGEEQ